MEEQVDVPVEEVVEETAEEVVGEKPEPVVLDLGTASLVGKSSLNS